jgi:hypothetical protein
VKAHEVEPELKAFANIFSNDNLSRRSNSCKQFKQVFTTIPKHSKRLMYALSKFRNKKSLCEEYGEPLM